MMARGSADGGDAGILRDSLLLPWCRYAAFRLSSCHVPRRRAPPAGDQRRGRADATWCGSPAPAGCQALPLTQIRTVLGRELGHCVLDWHPGCHAEALAALAGALRAGSWLILLTPPWSAWAQRPDDDSLRWSEREHPIATANFVHHLQRTLSDADGVTLWRQGEACPAPAPLRRGDTAHAAYAGCRQRGAGPGEALPGWLLIDEAAAIPTPLLQRLIAAFPHVLMTTTVQGYEGTGRGFLLKFCTALPDCRIHRLDRPLRWASGDPLECCSAIPVGRRRRSARCAGWIRNSGRRHRRGWRPFMPC